MVSGVSDAEGEGGGVVTKSQTKRCSSKEENLTKVTPAGGSILRKLKKMCCFKSSVFTSNISFIFISSPCFAFFWPPS